MGSKFMKQRWCLKCTRPYTRTCQHSSLEVPFNFTSLHCSRTLQDWIWIFPGYLNANSTSILLPYCLL